MCPFKKIELGQTDFFAILCIDNEIKEDDMGGTRSTHRINDESLQKLN
jgi:hypothetical protein